MFLVASVTATMPPRPLQNLLGEALAKARQSLGRLGSPRSAGFSLANKDAILYSHLRACFIGSCLFVCLFCFCLFICLACVCFNEETLATSSKVSKRGGEGVQPVLL